VSVTHGANPFFINQAAVSGTARALAHLFGAGGTFLKTQFELRFN
jgi:hypothetical protein